jgi:Holliday junction resolvase-like predicted endonuclease
MSGSTSRRKGNRAEVEVVAALKRAGWAAVTSRNARDGTQGGADVITDFPMVIEVKSVARTDLSGWWRQAQDQAGDELPVVIHKRVGHAKAEDWWVCMDMHTLLRLVERLDDGRT